MFFDFCEIDSCNFQNSDIQFSSFEARIIRTDFKNSELLQNNFNGIRAEDVSYNDSDLYSSRFMFSFLKTFIFKTVILKRPCFYIRKKMAFLISHPIPVRRFLRKEMNLYESLSSFFAAIFANTYLIGNEITKEAVIIDPAKLPKR